MSSSNNNDDGDGDDLSLSNIQTTCQLAFHGAAANSCPHSLLWVRAPSSNNNNNDAADDNDDGGSTDNNNDNNNNELVDTVIYASSGVINLATNHECLSNNNITSVNQTLVTRTLDHVNVAEKKVLARGEAAEDAAASRSVTALSWGVDGGDDGKLNKVFGIVAAFSDGTVTSWRYNNNANTSTSGGNTKKWVEHVLIGHDPQSASPINDGSNATTVAVEHNYEKGMDESNLQESISDISATGLDNNNGAEDACWIVATASSKGIFLHATTTQEEVRDGHHSNNEVNNKKEVVHSRQLSYHAAASVKLQTKRNENNNDEGRMKEVYLFAGSASPRHNKVWVYTIPYYTTKNAATTTTGDDNAPPSSWVALPALLTIINEPIYHGHLLGHQDWITCFAWLNNFNNGSSSSDTAGDNKSSTGRNEALLASSGHDAKIRLWKFSTWASTGSGSKEAVGTSGLPELAEEDDGSDDENSESDDEDEANIDDFEEEQGEARLIINHASSGEGCNAVTTTTTAVSLEALLLGHEEGVTSLTWRGNKSNTKPCLLSSSMDRTILLWMEEDDVWVPISRVGSAGGILGGSIGASLMGFVDATFNPTSNRIVGHGYGGSIHFWTQEAGQESDKVLNEANEVEEEDAMMMEETARWISDPCITGHFRSVEDIAWDPDGEYLLTTSSDQTTRLWTEVPVSSNRNDQYRWVEVGRPQVHGYDMTSIVCIGGGESEGGGGEPCHRFVSGADEKVLRVFDAPVSTLRTLQTLKQLCASSAGSSNSAPSSEAVVEPEEDNSWRVERAFMPSLGLSNKATKDEDQESSKFAGPTNNDEFEQTLDSVEGSGGSESSVQLKLPSERDLGVTTLWPETRKLFGHESELVCLDAYRAPGGGGGDEATTLVASSCKARNDVASAAIRLWDAKKGKCVGILQGGHRSTVSTMSFSKDGKYLASSGKDRRICIWKRVNGSVGSPGDGPAYELSAAADSAHKRIVWSVHFCPNRPDILASGSRDGLVKIWHVFELEDGGLDIKELLRFEPISKAGKNPITAVAFAEVLLKGKNGQTEYGILSIGTESGRIEVWAAPISSNTGSHKDAEHAKPAVLYAISSNDSHFDTVKKLAWRPVLHCTNASDEKTTKLTLASSGQDNSVRIFQLTVRNSSI